MVRDSCKPPPKTEAPWGSFDVPQTQTSTASAAYITYGPPKMREPVRPTGNHVMGQPTRFEGRSTAQDAYANHGTYMMRTSCKPANDWKTVDWMQPLSTTARAHFVDYQNIQRVQPFRPKREPPPDTKFDTRSTQQDAFPNRNIFTKPPEPFRPKEQERVDVKFDHTSTSRAAYVQHQVKPYVPAKKHESTMTFSE